MDTMTSPAANPAQLAGKHLTVVLGEETFGIAVIQVREIIRMQKITPVPQMPDFVKGVINLRGRVIPVIDLRMKFNLRADLGERTCVVVVQVNLGPDKKVQMGLIVDRVDEVINITEADIEPTPEFGVNVDHAFLLGMAKVKGQVETLIDINRVVAPEVLESSFAQN